MKKQKKMYLIYVRVNYTTIYKGHSSNLEWTLHDSRNYNKCPDFTLDEEHRLE